MIYYNHRVRDTPKTHRQPTGQEVIIMKNYEIRTGSNELIGKGETLEKSVISALNKISIDDFIEYCTYCKETTEGIEQYSMFELYDLAVELETA